MAANNTILPTATTQAPFWDDYDENKDFKRILFRPGFAVQGRELTQVQTIGQNQIQRLGESIYKNGSVVTGGQISYVSTATLNLAPQYNGGDINLLNFENNDIVDTSGANVVRATVLTTTTAANGTVPVLLVKYLSGNTFSPNATIQVLNQNVFANIASSNAAISNGSIVAIKTGTYFVNGFFANTPSQVVILDPFDNTPTARVGLQINEAIITEQQDSSLLDPAQGSSNYQAPGAGRYQLTLTLSTRSLSSTDDSQFIELIRIANGVVQQQVVFPTYSELGDTMARRTYDQSGSFTVRPFKIRLFNDPTGNTSQYQITLDPGKAYVFGYEFQTIAPTNIVARRGTDTSNTNNYQLAMNYGNFVEVGPLNGLFDTTSEAFVDMHCVVDANIQQANATTYAASKIGTARIRSILFDETANTLSGPAYVYSAYVTDTRFINITGNVAGANVLFNTVTLAGVSTSPAANAYQWATIYITTGLGAGQSGLITSYNGATRNATVFPPFATTPNTSSQYSIQFGFPQVLSFAQASGNTVSISANVNGLSRDSGGQSGNTIMSSPGFDVMLFPLPQSPIQAGSISGQSYSYRKFFGSRTFSAGVCIVSAGAGEQFGGNGLINDSLAAQDYIVVCTNNSGSANISNNQVIPFVASLGRSVNVSSGNSATFTANLPNDTFTASILATVFIDFGTETFPKSKTLISAQTQIVAVGSPDASLVTPTGGFANVFASSGQIILTNPNKTPGGNDLLYVSDVASIAKVYDFMGGTITGGAALPGSATDITNRYGLDTGQRDSFYDYGAALLNYTAPVGPLLICFNYYQHGSGSSDGLGYFDVDSYPNSSNANGYIAIPSYISPETGYVYQLRDCIDFRARRQDLFTTSPGFTLQGARIPISDSNFALSYFYYLPRIDKLVLTKNLQFKIIEGVSSLSPVPPNDLTNGMTLYIMGVPAYTFNIANVSMTYIENKRYTMRDIGGLEQRISDLEFYTSLSLLESTTFNQSIVDSNGLEQTKYGIVVDDFTGHSIGDVQNIDYVCAIDYENTTLVPSFNTVPSLLYFSSPASTGVVATGSLLTLPYTEVPFVTQNLASFSESVNPYNFAVFNGNMLLTPATDVWYDTTQNPIVISNASGQNDNWVAIGKSGAAANNDTRNPNGTRWNNWQSSWSGIDKQQQKAQQYSKTYGSTTSSQQSVTRSTPSVTESPTSALVTPTQSPDIPTDTIGNLTVDVSILPWMRSRDVLFQVSAMQPSMPVWFFFDSVAVTNYVQRPNKLVFSANVHFSANVRETITSDANIATVLVSHSGNVAWVANVIGTIQSGQSWSGSLSGNTGTVAAVSHYSGTAQAGGSNTITLASWANAGSNNEYVGNSIYIVSGSDIGDFNQIIAYNSITKVATCANNWVVTPTSNSRYSIGQPTTSGVDGSLAGTFVIPAYGAADFHVGTRLFQAMNSESGNTEFVTTIAEASYYAAGLLEVQTPTITSTQPPIIKQPTIVSNVVVKTTTAPSVPAASTWTGNQRTGGQGGSGNQGGNGDPLSETFFVDPNVYPEGVFLSSVNLFFFAKDSSLPVWINICGTDNGYPDDTTAVPYSSVSLNPDQVNTSLAPDASNTATATKFTFPSPVFLAPGQYALIVGSDTPNYQVYIATLGQNILGTNRQISQQPYIGSLFKSQNASTWDADQNSDLMFILNRCDFTNAIGTTGFAIFLNASPLANAKMDVAFVTDQELTFNSTQMTTAFKSTSGTFPGTILDSNWTNFILNQNYPFNDALGRRTLLANNDGSFQIRYSLTTTSPYVSPVVDTQRTNLLAIENDVNYGGFTNTNITLTSPGIGVTNAANLAITISGGSGSGANAYVPQSAINNGNVNAWGIIVDSAGTLYSDQAIITFVGGGGTAPVGVLASELNAHGGNYNARYISRAVTLAQGFNAGDLKVFITAHKTINHDVEVYAKILSENDPTTFVQRPWVHMVQGTPSTVLATGTDDFNEYQYNIVASGNSFTYQSGTASFSSFNTFAIKIVLGSKNTTDVPVIHDMRGIALPASS